MGEPIRLPDDVATLFAGALHAIARADGDITLDEGARLQALVARHSDVAVDPEMLFFDQTTPESFAQALRGGGPHRTAIDARSVGLALVDAAVVLSTCDGDLNGKEARTILRFARALGCTAEDVHAITDQLDEWLSDLA